VTTHIFQETSGLPPKQKAGRVNAPPFPVKRSEVLFLAENLSNVYPHLNLLKKQPKVPEKSATLKR
jgi:hypothetical protein